MHRLKEVEERGNYGLERPLTKKVNIKCTELDKKYNSREE